MSRLAIQGHLTRGSEVIALLEMLGGENINVTGGDVKGVYLISTEGTIEIHYTYYKRPENYVVFTLEEFLEKFPYKVGDKVIFTKYGDKDIVTIQSMIWTGTTIEYTYNGCCTCLTKDLQPYKEQETIEEKTYPPYMDYDVKTIKTMKKEILPYFLTVYDSEVNKHEIVATDGYEIKEENGKFYAVKQKPKYPKTYEECCSVLKMPNDERYIDIDVPLNYNKLLYAFTELIICRDAYWKTASEEMGLDKPWEPDWLNTNSSKYCIYYVGDEIKKQSMLEVHHFLAFPTREIRDAFYENFKDLIEQCKELL